MYTNKPKWSHKDYKCSIYSKNEKTIDINISQMMHGGQATGEEMRHVWMSR